MENKAMMQDLDLQRKCIEASATYMKTIYPNLADIEKAALIKNACAAGFGMGYRRKEEEMFPVKVRVGKQIYEMHPVDAAKLTKKEEPNAPTA